MCRDGVCREEGGGMGCVGMRCVGMGSVGRRDGVCREECRDEMCRRGEYRAKGRAIPQGARDLEY